MDHGRALAAPAAAALDWHNARAALLLDLDAKLDEAGSDTDRAHLLERLAKDVAGWR